MITTITNRGSEFSGFANSVAGNSIAYIVDTNSHKVVNGVDGRIENLVTGANLAKSKKSNFAKTNFY